MFFIQDPKTKAEVLLSTIEGLTIVKVNNDTFWTKWNKMKEGGLTKNVVYLNDSEYWDSRGIDTIAPNPELGIAVIIARKPLSPIEEIHDRGRVCRHNDKGALYQLVFDGDYPDFNLRLGQLERLIKDAMK